MADKPILEAVNVTRHFRKRRTGSGLRSPGLIQAVDGVNLAISKGDTIGLVGESGCGKSTLSRLLLLLERTTSGEVRYRGTPATALSKRQLADFRKDVQPVFQDPFQSLNPKLRIGRIVSEPLRAQGTFTVPEMRRRVAEALERVELRSSDADRKPVDFSGGQRQRIAIARALVSRPRMIVLDEPVSSQDVSIRAQILNLLKDIRDEQDVAYLFISHDLSTVRFLCERVHVMYQGRIVEAGATEQIFSNPGHPYTQTLLESWLPPDPALARGRREARRDGKTQAVT